MRGRQLRARALRPLARRRFPRGEPPRDPAPVTAAEALWRSPAFEAVARPERLHRQYGEDVLSAARVGDAAEARRLVQTWVEAHPPRKGEAWDPYPLSMRIGNWIAALTLRPDLGSREMSASLWWQLRRLDRDLEEDVLGTHAVHNARALGDPGRAMSKTEIAYSSRCFS